MAGSQPVTARLDPGLLSQFIAQHPTTEFFIVSTSSRHQVDGFLASIHSEKIAQLFAADPCANSITVHPLFLGDMEPVLAALRGEAVDVPEAALLSTIDIAVELLIEPLVDSLAARATNVLRPEQAVRLLKKAFESGADCRIFADCVAALFNRSVAAPLSNEQLDLVLQSPFLEATPEDITPILYGRVDFARQPNHRLAKHLPIKEMLNLRGTNLNFFRFAMIRFLPPV
jgi:hypothetical protein